MKLSNITKFFISIFICEMAGIAGNYFTSPEIYIWYEFLNKPSFNPPGWLFGPIWTVMYALMGIALYIVWSKKWNVRVSAKDEKKKLWNVFSQKLWTGDWRKTNAILVFSVQLILNILWSAIFFSTHSVDVAFFEILTLWFAILFTVVNFYRISKTASLLLVPYLLWVSFAAVLNYYIWILN